MYKQPLKCIYPIIIALALSLAGCGDSKPDEPQEPEPVQPGQPVSPEEPVNPGEPAETLPVPGLSFSSLNLSNSGDTFACRIHGQDATSWSAQSSADWCTAVLADGILKITAKANDQQSDRTASVAVLDEQSRTLGRIAVNQKETQEPQPIEVSAVTRNSFFPLFTATWCPFSPEMEPSLEEIQRRLERPILPMRIHVIHSELYTSLSEELSEIYDNTSTPTGYFDNSLRIGNMIDGNVSIDAFWNSILAATGGTATYTDVPAKIECKSSMTDNDIFADITLKAVDGSYKLQVFVLEDGLIAPQTTLDGESVTNFVHNDVLIDALTPVAGEEIVNMPSNGITFSFSKAIPTGANPSNLRLLIVVSRNTPRRNFSAKCWFTSNCLSTPLGKTTSNGQIESIYTGEEIKH